MSAKFWKYEIFPVSLHQNYRIIMLLQKNIVKKYLALLSEEQTLAAWYQSN